MKKIIPGILLLLTLHAFSQEKDYLEYYKLVNKAEEEFVLKMDSSCFQFYDRAFARNRPFLKDPYSAAQMALYLNDTIRFRHYLAVAFANGMPLKAVTASNYIRERYYPKLYKTVAVTFKQYYRQPEIDSLLLGKICLMCYQSDSLKLKTGGESRAFYASENNTRTFLLDSLLKKGIFANEHLLGITSNDLWDDFYRKFDRKALYADSGQANSYYPEEYALRLKCPMNIVLHSPCFFQENKRHFMQAVLWGYLHPKDYGILEETSVIWFQERRGNPAEKCMFPAEVVSYNIFGTDPKKSIQTYDATPEGLKRANANRTRVGMQKYEIDKRKKELEEKYGFAFFFDFLDRP